MGKQLMNSNDLDIKLEMLMKALVVLGKKPHSC